MFWREQKAWNSAYPLRENNSELKELVYLHKHVIRHSSAYSKTLYGVKWHEEFEQVSKKGVQENVNALA
jgi:hypothetical protein